MTADSLLWCNATRIHDWSNLETPLQILSAWIALGLVADAEWVEGANGRTRKISIPTSKLGDAIRSEPLGRGDRLIVQVGGSKPREWAVTVVLFPKGAGMNMFNLTVALNNGMRIGSRVSDSFLSLYSPETADSAFIHADPQWTQLATESYKPPLVTTPTFAGVFWANYLGPGHLSHFSVPKLQAIQAYRTEWRDDRAMFLVTAPTLEEVLTPGGEGELKHLTEEFRAAKV